MGNCCRRESKDLYVARQADKLRAKLTVYSEGKIDRYNIIRNIAFGMMEIAKKRLDGATKKQIVMDVIISLLNPNSYPPELMNTIVDNFIEDIYVSFQKTFAKKCCRR